jgi:hypothetical protein
MANTDLPPQSSKVRSIKGFGENISQLPLCINISHLNISLLYMVSQEVVSPLKVSHSFCGRLDFRLQRWHWCCHI